MFNKQMKTISLSNNKMVWVLLLLTSNLCAQSLDYSIRESIPVPIAEGVNRVEAVGDMDGDGVLDIVFKNSAAGRFLIQERDAGTFVTRFTFTEPTQLRAFVVAEVDGDGQLCLRVSGRGGSMVLGPSTD